MAFVLDAIITLISVAFLLVLAAITGAAIPGLFLAVAAPWLDWLLPVRRDDRRRPEREREPATTQA